MTKTDTHKQTLEAAYDKARSALKKKVTTENIKCAEAARKALEAYRAELAAQADPSQRRFKTLTPEVLVYLKSEGWKIEKTKLYADEHKISREEDGTFAKKAVDDYARLCLKQLDGSDQSDEGLAKKTAQVELDILEEKKKEAIRENEIEDGRWVLRSDVESMLAGRASLLKSGLGPEFIHAHAGAVIRLTGGDTGKAPDLIEYWLNAMEEHFDRYSRPMEFAAPAGANNQKEE